MSIHKEGIKILIFLILLLLTVNLLIRHFFLEDMVLRYFVISASLLLFFFVLQFFRHPNIKVPYNDNHILAPADGKVVVVEKTIEEECLKDERIQISIFMSPVNVHVNRSPARGTVKYFKYHPGKYFVAWHPKSSTMNERTTMMLTLKNGLDIVVRQIAGIMARRIKFYVKEGDKNAGVILENITKFGTQFVLAQKFINKVSEGDKRIIILNGKPIGSVLRVAKKGGEFRCNFHSGGSAHKSELTKRDRVICDAVSERLVSDGLYFVVFTSDRYPPITSINPICSPVDLVCPISKLNDESFPSAGALTYALLIFFRSNFRFSCIRSSDFSISRFCVSRDNESSLCSSRDIPSCLTVNVNSRSASSNSLSEITESL